MRRVSPHSPSLCLLLWVALIMTTPATGLAEEVVLLDELVGKGSHEFEILANPGAESVELIATPGATRGRDRVSVAALWLNGERVLRPRDFNQNVAAIARNLQTDTLNVGENIVEIEVGGKPTSKLRVRLVAEYPDAQPPGPILWVDWYRDFDFDGFGSGAALRRPLGVAPPAPPPIFQWVTINGDCAEGDPESFPGSMCP